MKRRSSFRKAAGNNAFVDFRDGADSGDSDGPCSSCSIAGCGSRDGVHKADRMTATSSNHSESSVSLFLNQTSDAINAGRRRRGKKRFPKKKDDDNKSGEHTNLSSLIASELSLLSIEDREKALEEVHGVIQTTDEDPEKMKNLFDQVKEELKRIRYKQAYEKAAFRCSSYVADPEFVVLFLRADNYNPRKAAIRLVEHFKYKLELFEDKTLVRDIMYDDLDEGGKSVLKSGLMQTLPTPDRAGRQVMLCNLSEFLKTGTLMDVNRAAWYLTLRNSQMHRTSSQLGIVGVYFTHGMGNVFEKLYREHLIHGTAFLGKALPLKFASVHFCFERNTLATALQTTLMILSLIHI